MLRGTLSERIELYSSQVRFNFKRRGQSQVYRVRALRLSSKLRQCRADLAWMLGLNPYDAQERRAVRIDGILRKKKKNRLK